MAILVVSQPFHYCATPGSSNPVLEGLTISKAHILLAVLRLVQNPRVVIFKHQNPESHQYERALIYCILPPRSVFKSTGMNRYKGSPGIQDGSYTDAAGLTDTVPGTAPARIPRVPLRGTLPGQFTHAHQVMDNGWVVLRQITQDSEFNWMV
ncbi:hypothetical protein BDN72DRAFT_865008 [Pluteus cervinus]|uniref:Uncharacterized protein n=1 Tax=Pluteus cervinus TaxID=181527 RepID=A0ACD3A1U1_9AGAR|nr:hypothetical protein BDN72DRAFT_865008 [Pluteus cervinus]